MACNSDFVYYIVDQCSDAGEIVVKKMMGDYCIYCDGILWGLICDNNLYVKVTEPGRAVLKEVILRPPYDGAKDHFYITDVDDRDYLTSLIKATVKALTSRKVDDKPTFRPMRRFKQALPQEECFRILKQAYRGFLSVNGDGGYPYSVPINFVFEDGKLYFHSAREGHKLDAIRACDKACFTVLDEPEKEPDDWWYHVKSVICFGRIGIVTDETERVARLRSLAGKYFPADYDTEADILRNGPRTEILAFTIEHISGKAVKEN